MGGAGLMQDSHQWLSILHSTVQYVRNRFQWKYFRSLNSVTL